MTDLEPRTSATEPGDPARHAELLAGLLRRILNNGSAGFFRSLSPTMETERIDLALERQRIELTPDEIEALAVENNRAWRDSA